MLLPRRPSRRRPQRRRVLPAIALTAVASLTLAACGSQGDGNNALGASAAGLDAVSVSGAVGSPPQVEWKSTMTASSAQTTVLTQGTGPAIGSGDTAFVDFWVGDGTTQKSGLFNTFGAKGKPVAITPGTPSTNLASINDLIGAFIAQQLQPGVTVGSRIAITADATTMLGNYVFASDATKKNIGNLDGMLIVADVVSPVLAAPNGAQQPQPSWAPSLKFDKNRNPTSFDFSGVPALGDKLKVGLLKKGTGAVVKKGDTIVVDYLGQIPSATAPFDESYTKQDFTTVIGTGAVVKGWDQGLIGQRVGGRVLLGIPASLGYGSKAQGKAIPANSTLYFVIDLLGAS